MTAALQFRNLTLGYDRHPAVHHLDGAVESGALVAVVGPNGAGKSTLFKGIVGVLKPLAGAIERGGLSRRTSPICRRPPRSTARSRSTSTTWWRWGCGAAPACSAASAATRARAIEQALAAVGLTGFEDRAIATLSGGQMQRMLFARLLLQDARVIVLDEPFNAVDAKTSADLFDLVQRWHGEQRTVLTAHARHRFRALAFSRNAAAGARAGRLGPHLDGADAGKPPDRAPHVRGVRRARGPNVGMPRSGGA